MATPDGQESQVELNDTGLDPVPLTPPADCIAVTDDRGVLKHVVAEGSGDLPVLHGRCLGE